MLSKPRSHSDNTITRRASNDAPEGRDFGLTKREVEVLHLVVAGLTNREISAALFISRHTVSVHVSHILAKLGVRNRVMATAAAYRMGLAPVLP